MVDELGYLPMSREEANLFFRLVARRYERASLIITSNKSFIDWGEVFGDQVLATAILDRLLHHSIIDHHGRNAKLIFSAELSFDAVSVGLYSRPERCLRNRRREPIAAILSSHE